MQIRQHFLANSLPGKSRGLSMAELLVTLSIVAILLGVALPSYTNLTATYRVKGASSEIYLSMIRARSEAARLNQSVTIAPSSPSDWRTGWTLKDTGANTLYIQDALSGISISGSPGSIIYMSSGRIKGTVSPSFAIAAVNGRGETRCVSVDLAGRPYVKKGTTC